MAYKKKIAGITIEIDGDTSKLVKSLDKVSTKIGKIGNSISKVGTKLTKSLTVPIAGMATAAVKNYADVDKIMVLTNQTMGNTTEQAEILQKAMQDAASSSIFTMEDAANATLNFARAGLKAEQAASALGPSMKLAAGEGGNLDVVSAGLVGTINAFGDSFDNADYYANIFAAACNNSMLDVDSLSDSMASAATVFHAAGYNVEDAALYMGIMANNSIPAAEAANSLGTGFARLVSPAKQGREMMEKLGISVTNADGSMKDSITIQKELHEAFSGLSESEQIAAASAIFGKNQMDNWLALINTAPEDVDALNTSLSSVEGTTDAMADAMMNGFGGSIERVKSSLDVLMYSFGSLISEYLVPVIAKIQSIVDAFNALDDAEKDRIIKIAAIVAAVGPVLLVIGKVVSGVSSIISIVSSLIAVLPVLAGPVGIVIAAIAALVAIGVALYKNWDKIKEFAGELGNWLKEKWNNIRDTVSGAVDGIKMANSRAWDAVKQKVEENGGGIEGVIKTYAQTCAKIWEDRFNKIDEITGGKLSEALNKASTKLGEIKKTFTETFDKIKEKVKKAIDYIKGLFDFEWHFPKLQLPHFGITGQFSFNPPSVPDISVDWYKKAMNGAYMLNDATIFGARGNTLLGGGEAGAEMIIGTNKLMNMIARAKGGETVITNTFNINGVDRDPQELASEISFYLNMELQRTEGAFA